MAIAVYEEMELEMAEARPRHLRLLETTHEIPRYMRGPTIADRRRARAAMMQRRRRSLVAVTVLACVSILCVPGTVFGATTSTGVSSDMGNASSLAPGMAYTVQPGDTLRSIATLINPDEVVRVIAQLKAELGSSVVVPGELVYVP